MTRQKNTGIRLKRGIVRRFKGFPDETQNEGYAEYAAMSPHERLELAQFIFHQYIFGILNLREYPRLDRAAIRIFHRGDPRD